jgi:hypothetical protein
MAQMNVVVMVVIFMCVITCPVHPWYPPRVAWVAKPSHMNVVDKPQNHMVVVAVAGHTVPHTQPPPMAVMVVSAAAAPVMFRS